MRAACGALLVAGLVLLAAPLAAGAAEPVSGESFGRYRVTRTGDGIEITRPRDRGIGLAVAAGGAVLAALGAGLVATGRLGTGGGALVLGLGLLVAGGFGSVGETRWRASRSELACEGFGGRVERWPRAALAALEVERRAPSADDFKRATARPWDVRLRGPDGAKLPVRFALDSEAQARALAGALAEALGLPPPGP